MLLWLSFSIEDVSGFGMAACDSFFTSSDGGEFAFGDDSRRGGRLKTFALKRLPVAKATKIWNAKKQKKKKTFKIELDG